jgi:hypothetical protein
MDPAPALDPAKFALDFQEQPSFSAYYFLNVHLQHFSKIKSHKEDIKQ